MPIPESTLSRWSHHRAGTAFKQAHVPIREALDAYKGLSPFKYEVFLQGSYKNDTNLGGDSDVDVVVRLGSKLKPRVADLTGQQLQEDAAHKVAYQRWKSFRDHALKAMRARFRNAANGRTACPRQRGSIASTSSDPGENANCPRWNQNRRRARAWLTDSMTPRGSPDSGSYARVKEDK